MSTMTITSSSLPRAYIGARRNRHYINNNSTTSFSSSLSNDYVTLKTPLSKSFQPIQSKEKNYLSNTETTDALQTQQEEQASIKYLSSTSPLDEQELNLQLEQKAKGFLPSSSSSSSSSSRFLFPTIHNVTPLSDYDHSLPSFDQQQQHFNHSSFHDEQHSYQQQQPLNTEDKNNSFVLYNKLEQHKQKQLRTYHQNFDLSDVPEEDSSSSSTYSLTDISGKQNDNDNQSDLLTSTPIFASISSNHRLRTNNNNISPLLSPDKTYSHKPLTLTLDTINDQSSTISTVGLITDIQHKADVCQLNNMSSSLSSSLRYSSNLGTGTLITHPYDQRITDQGNKYIIQLKTDEYQENDFIITPRYTLHQLIIDAKHREEDHIGGYIHRELHKIFNIPKHIDLNRHTYSYNKSTQELTIEMPYLLITNENCNDSKLTSTIEPLTYLTSILNQNTGETILPTTKTIRSNYYNDNSNNTSGIGTTVTDSTLTQSGNTTIGQIHDISSIGKTKPFDFDLFHRSVFRPQIVNDNNNIKHNNEKKLLMSLDLSDYQAEDIKVSIKDRELIVKAERIIETDTRKSRTSFFQSTSLPPQTDIEHLQSNYIDGKLIIEAPYLEQKFQTTNTLNNNQGTNWKNVTETEKKTIIDDPFQHRTETVTELVRVRRI